MGHKVAGTTGLYLHVMRETFDKVDVILDQAFGDALRAQLGDPPAPTSPATAADLRTRRF